MSKKNRLEQKKLRRLRRNLKPGPATTKIDIVDWLKDRGYAKTTGEACEIILDGRLKSESHTIGIEKKRVQMGDFDQILHIVERHQPAHLKSTLYVKE